MRVFLLGATLILSLASSALAIDVYVVAGQSNGWRLSSISAYPNRTDQHKIYYFPMACSSRPTESSLAILNSLHQGTQGAGLAEGLLKCSNDDIVIVQYCVCGTSLHDPLNWYPGDDPANGVKNDTGLYASCLKTIASARQQVEAEGLDWNVKALFWHQGESDAINHSAAYEASIRKLFGRFREDLGNDLPIIAGHIRDLDDQYKAINSALDAAAASDKNTAVVKTADQPFESATDVHFKTPGCHEIGRRMVAAYIEMQKR